MVGRATSRPCEVSFVCTTSYRARPREAFGYTALAGALGFQGRFEDAIENARRGIGVNPNFDRAHFLLGMWLIYSGKPELGIEPLRTALRLSPNDPWRWQSHQNIALAHYLLQDYRRAAEESRLAVSSKPDHVRSNSLLIASLAQLGDVSAASRALAFAEAQGAVNRVSSIASHFFFKSSDDASRIAEGLRLAGAKNC